MLQPATLMCNALGLEMPGLRRDAQTSRRNAPPTTRGGEGGKEGGTTRCPGTALDAPVGRWLPTLSSSRRESRSCPRLLEHRPALTLRALFQDQRLAQRERKTKQGECLSDDRILSSQLKTISSVRHLFVNVLDLEDHDVLYNGDVDGDAGVEYRSAGWCRNVRASAFKSFKVVRPSDTNHFTSLPCKVQLVMKIVLLFYL